MSILLRNAKVFTPSGIVEHGVVLVANNGTIAYAGPTADAPGKGEREIDLAGRIVAPGFIDAHVHGGHGVTFGEGNLAENLRTYSRWVAGTGVTGFLCSIAARDGDALTRLIAAYAEILDAGVDGAECLGLHLEGPFLNPLKKGAFNPKWLRQPALEEAKSCLQAGRGWIRQATIAPELPQAQAVAKLFARAGVVVAMGHTDADYETAARSLQGVFRHVTHTFNAQRGFDHRAPGPIGAILASDAITAEVIADLVHIHPGVLKIMCRCLGPERVVLITDAMAGAGLPDGKFDLVGNRVTVRDGKATLADGTIAGSSALLNQCVRNMSQAAGISLYQAAQMASRNPAQALRLDARLGSLGKGKDANLVVMDEQADIYLTMVKGKIVCTAPQFSSPA